MALGAVLLVNDVRSRLVRAGSGLGGADLHAVRLVRHGHPERARAASSTSRSTCSFRWGMSWFIFSEVMFFAAFFGALFYMRVLSVPWLASGDTGRAALARLQRPLAGLRPGHRGRLRADGRLGHPGDQHVDPAASGRHRDLGALGAEEEQPHAAHLGPVPDHRAGLPVPVSCRRTNITTPTPRWA